MTNRTSISRKRAIAGAISIGLAASISLAGCGGDEGPGSASSTSAARSTMSPEDAAAQSAANAAAAEEDRKAAAEEAEKTRIANAEAAERNRVAREAEAAQAAAKFDRSTYPALDGRAFSLLAKEPDAHIGEKFVAYGYVTQFDANTGSTGFRANVGSYPGGRSDYDVNTIVQGTAPVLAPIVEDDFITMYVEVAGAYEYETTMGGSTTALKLTANVIDVTG